MACHKKQPSNIRQKLLKYYRNDFRWRKRGDPHFHANYRCFFFRCGATNNFLALFHNKSECLDAAKQTYKQRRQKRLWNFLFNFMFVTRLYLWAELSGNVEKTQMSKKNLLDGIGLTDEVSLPTRDDWCLKVFQVFCRDSKISQIQMCHCLIECVSVFVRYQNSNVALLSVNLMNQQQLFMFKILLQFSIPFRVCNFVFRNFFLPFILSLFCYTIWFIIIEWSFNFAFFHRSHSLKPCMFMILCVPFVSASRQSPHTNLPDAFIYHTFVYNRNIC